MTPQELAAEVEHTVRQCTDRITGIGAEQYAEPGKPQKFETMPLDGLLEYYGEELRDIINYAVMTTIRFRRLRAELAERLDTKATPGIKPLSEMSLDELGDAYADAITGHEWQRSDEIASEWARRQNVGQ